MERISPESPLHHPGLLGPSSVDSSGMGLSDSSYSCSDDGSISGSRRTRRDAETGSPIVSTKDNNAVSLSKIAVILVLAMAACIVGSGTFNYTTYQEEQDFRVRFGGFADAAIDVININAANSYEVLNSWSTHLTNYALMSGSKFPFVTYQHYERQQQSTLAGFSRNTAVISPLLKSEQREDYEKYAMENNDWIDESYEAAGLKGNKSRVSPYIFRDFRSGQPANGTISSLDLYAPVSQGAPIEIAQSIINFDLFQFGVENALKNVLESRRSVIGESYNLGPTARTPPESYALTPIFESFEPGAPIVGLLTVLQPWADYFTNLIPSGSKPIILVVETACTPPFSYRIEGLRPFFLGIGDFHDEKYDDIAKTANFTAFPNTNECPHTFNIYPTDQFRDEFLSKNPAIFTAIAMGIFLLAILNFIVYDRLVERRNKIVLTTATRSNAIVTSLFPETVRDRLMEDADRSNYPPRNYKASAFSTSVTQQLGEFDMDESNHGSKPSSDPIADLFPSATVLFADVVGFTAWSSKREPTHVFKLLEALYGAFDAIANRRGVFKVETIGDCYVAATGLPIKREDHAIVMCKFARDCLLKMPTVTRRLEEDLGPDTTDLSMRFGLHSGPVTAGVLRGERSRFQLFGDTVNTAARMESNGKRDMIHLSQECASLIVDAGKDSWIRPREDLIEAKGKGLLQTYWLAVSPGSSSDSIDISRRPSLCGMSTASIAESYQTGVSDKTVNNLGFSSGPKSSRLLDWNVEVMARLLKRVIAARCCSHLDDPIVNLKLSSPSSGAHATVIEEMNDVIKFPRETSTNAQDLPSIELSDEVMDQLRSFIILISTMYVDVPFHCFEHASHVTQSIVKMLSKISAESDSPTPDGGTSDYKSRIISDPLVQFAAAFAGLVHDVDHPGVPNAILVAEGTPLAAYYKNKSIAEQNSMDVAWSLLLEDTYSSLRDCIFETQSELERFHQILVNSIMATDIVDKDQAALRRIRWEKAFSASLSVGNVSPFKQANRKATIVLELLIQASDVSHTMQNWHIYIKWNERLFQEFHQAFADGRSQKDPAVCWYENELSFFDYYVIPLAQKLRDCGAFGFSSDEFLSYAYLNKSEWQEKGQEIIEGYVSRIKK